MDTELLYHFLAFAARNRISDIYLASIKLAVTILIKKPLLPNKIQYSKIYFLQVFLTIKKINL